MITYYRLYTQIPAPQLIVVRVPSKGSHTPYINLGCNRVTKPKNRLQTPFLVWVPSIPPFTLITVPYHPLQIYTDLYRSTMTTFQIQLDRILRILNPRGPTHASGPKKPTLSQLDSKVK